MHFPRNEAAEGLDVLVVGSVNIDLGFTLVRMMKAGETIESLDMHRSGGGKGANQALAAAQLGARTGLLAAVGSEADFALKDLSAAEVDLEMIVRFDDEPTGTAVLLVTPEDNAIVIAAGANGLLAPEHVTAVAGACPTPAVVVLQHEVPRAVVEAAVSSWAGHAKILLNPSPFRPVSAELLKKVDLVVVNRIELAQLLEASEPTGIDSARDLLTASGLASAVVTLGADGILVLEDGVIHEQPAVVVDAIDTVGAGDAFLGALAAALATGESLLDASAHAAAAAALVVTVRGARNKYLTADAVEALRGDAFRTSSSSTPCPGTHTERHSA